MGVVTLSFDNGPDPAVTPLVLDVLARHRLQATFFVIGRKVEAAGGRALVERAHTAGHWIGNHTYSHRVPLGHFDDEAEEVAEIARTEALIAAFAQPSPLFRPYGQGGILDARVLGAASLQYLLARRYTCVAWNAVPRDWQDPSGWADTALAQIAALPESVLVLHDIGSGAMAHLDRFLEMAQARGHRFRQDFAACCTLIAAGEARADIADFVTVDRLPAA